MRVQLSYGISSMQRICIYREDLLPFNLFLFLGFVRSPEKSSIIHELSVEDDMLCRRAVGRIPHCLASVTSFLFSAMLHRKPGICTDNPLVPDD